MSDLVQRLRNPREEYQSGLLTESADRIEALEKDNKDLIETLSGHDSDTEHMVAELAKRSDRIEALEAALRGTITDTRHLERIEALEAALRQIATDGLYIAVPTDTLRDIARRALGCSVENPSGTSLGTSSEHREPDEEKTIG